MSWARILSQDVFACHFWVMQIYLVILVLSLIANMVVSAGRYVEPSIRPDDSRYGENPNRLQRHTQFQVNFEIVHCRKSKALIDLWTQRSFWGVMLAFNVLSFTLRVVAWNSFQVILKPDPGNSQDLFIRSLSALGSHSLSCAFLLTFFASINSFVLSNCSFFSSLIVSFYVIRIL